MGSSTAKHGTTWRWPRGRVQGAQGAFRGLPGVPEPVDEGRTNEHAFRREHSNGVVDVLQLVPLHGGPTAVPSRWRDLSGRLIVNQELGSHKRLKKRLQKPPCSQQATTNTLPPLRGLRCCLRPPCCWPRRPQASCDAELGLLRRQLLPRPPPQPVTCAHQWGCWYETAGMARYCPSDSIYVGLEGQLTGLEHDVSEVAVPAAAAACRTPLLRAPPPPARPAGTAVALTSVSESWRNRQMLAKSGQKTALAGDWPKAIASQGWLNEGRRRGDIASASPAPMTDIANILRRNGQFSSGTSLHSVKQAPACWGLRPQSPKREASADKGKGKGGEEPPQA